jgi:hypothetical protein
VKAKAQGVLAGTGKQNPNIAYNGEREGER